jgi:hypothetical protein
MLTETEIWFVATFYKKIASILLKNQQYGYDFINTRTMVPGLFR